MNTDTMPKASRLHMSGYGLLAANAGRGLWPWAWAIERLAQARTYWIATTRPDGRPHAMPIWGVWLDNGFQFSTDSRSRKARNLAVNSHCVVSIEVGDEAIIVEGSAQSSTDPTVIQRFTEVYVLKYQWDMTDFVAPIFIVRPKVAFAFNASTGEFTGSATRWVFEKD